MNVVLNIIDNLYKINYPIIFMFLSLFLLPTVFYLKEIIYMTIISSFVIVGLITKSSYIILGYYYMLIIFNFIIGLRFFIKTSKERGYDKEEQKEIIKCFLILYGSLNLITTVIILITIYLMLI